MTRSEKAMNYFVEGYNCAQSVALAFSDMLPMTDKEIARMASSFGGGMGRLREVCGAVSGMLMIVGEVYGYDGPETGEPKAALYARVQEVAKRFEARSGSIICRELLGLTEKRKAPTPEARTLEYYNNRPCKALVGLAAEVLEEYMQEQEEK